METITPITGDRIYYICGNRSVINLKYVKYLEFKDDTRECKIIAHFTNSEVVVDTGAYDEIKNKYNQYVKTITSINIEGVRKFLKQVKFVMPVRHRDRSVIVMAMMELVISRDRVDTLLSEYAYYYPYC